MDNILMMLFTGGVVTIIAGPISHAKLLLDLRGNVTLYRAETYGSRIAVAGRYNQGAITNQQHLGPRPCVVRADVWDEHRALLSIECRLIW
mmetsp:Transcript_9835/g.12327  ORF Transcript_9835/g.12327 Transcript_9835/m.12327 type:complete len:91 (-) Transcript_9835:424-696(-)